MDDTTKTGAPDASHVLLHDFLEGLYEGIILTDPDGTIEDVNSRASLILGYADKMLAGLKIQELVSGFDSAVLQNIAGALKEQPHVVLEAHCVRKDRSNFPAEIAVHRVTLTSREYLCFSIRDVSTRQEAQERLKEAEEDLFEAERAKTRVETIAKLAHEINNPLQVLMAMVEEDRNNRYASPLNRIVSVMQEMRLNEAVRSVGFTPSEAAVNLPPSGREQCNSKALLIADDEPTLRHFFRSIVSLNIPNLSIEVVSNGRDAVEIFGLRHPAVIILDISMPIMSGDEAYHEITRMCRKNNWEMPAVIFCTGYTPPESVRRAIAAEPLHCYLSKPVTSDSLINAVKNRLEFFDLSHALPAAQAAPQA